LIKCNDGKSVVALFGVIHRTSAILTANTSTCDVIMRMW